MPPRTKRANRGQSSKGKEKVTHELDISSQFGATFPIFTQEEGKKFLNLSRRQIITPRLFNFDLLAQMGVRESIERMCVTLGWSKLVHSNFITYKELTLEFYTTLQFESKSPKILKFRLNGQEYSIDYQTMTDIFDLPRKGVYEDHDDFNLDSFWHKLTREDEFSARNAPNGLIIDLSYLLLHKFMCHAVFGKKESNKCSRKELFIMWCLHSKTKVSTTYHIFQTLMKIATHRNTTIGMGHIVTGLALHFGINISFDELTPLENEMFSNDTLIRAEILQSHGFGIREPNDRTCVKHRQHRPVPRRPTEETTDSSSDEENEEEGNDAAGWQQVLAKVEETNQRLTVMEDQIKTIQKHQRYQNKKLLKYFQQSGIQVPSPTPSPLDSPGPTAF